MSKPFDATLKGMLERGPADWPALAGYTGQQVEVIDADVSTFTAASDKVLRVRGDPDWLLDVNFQTGPDATLPRRMHVYSALLEDRHDVLVHSLAVLLSPKAVLKATWLTVDEFNRVRRGEPVLPGEQPGDPKRVVSKNRIDRLTNTAGGAGGDLFEFTEFCLPAVDVYWRIADEYVSTVEEFLEDLRRTGYGKRKSVGYGEIASFRFEPFDGFPEIAGCNGFVTLSNFVPARSDPAEGFWTTAVKYGKLGEEAAEVKTMTDGALSYVICYDIAASIGVPHGGAPEGTACVTSRAVLRRGGYGSCVSGCNRSRWLPWRPLGGVLVGLAGGSLQSDEEGIETPV